MNKKVVICCIVVVVLIAVVVCACILLNNKNSGKEISLEELNTEIAAKEPFSQMAMQDIDADTLSSLYEIEADKYEAVVGKMPMMNIQASMYLIIKAKDDSVDYVKEKVENYGQKQEEIWSTYLPEQYELVKQRKLDVVGNYVYLIISENASEVEQLIKK